jgi:transposase
MNSLLIIRLKYLGAFGCDFNAKVQWFRDFSVPESITLEELNGVIQTILRWDDTHLYVFRVKDKNYAFFGLDHPIIIDSSAVQYLSCDVPLKNLDLKKNEEISYDYDFGDHQRFSLKINEIKNKPTSEHKPFAKLLSYKGKDIRQYPHTQFDSFFEFEESDPSDLQLRVIPYIEWTKAYKWTVRFIQKDDYDTLQLWRKSRDKKKWERAVVILENWNFSLDALSIKIERPVAQLKKWITGFNANGLTGIDPKRKKRDTTEVNRKTKEKTKRIIEILHNRPATYGINRSAWSLASLATAYQNKYSERIGSSTVGRLVRQSRYSIKKARNVLTSLDPEYREKVELLLKILSTLKPDEDVFFIDELGPIRVKKYGGRRYTKKGESLTVPQNQAQKGSVTLHGALSATTNQMSWMYGPSKDTSAMIDLVEILFNQYQTKSKIYITWDSASWHRSNELTEWLNTFNVQTQSIGYGPIIELIPLPSNSQFLNVIEAVFSAMKRAIIHFSNYLSTAEMKTAISKHFLDRNAYFKENPKRAGKKIWEVDFFKDYENIRSGNYRDW